jgi:hypothetical protein
MSAKSQLFFSPHSAVTAANRPAIFVQNHLFGSGRNSLRAQRNSQQTVDIRTHELCLTNGFRVLHDALDFYQAMSSLLTLHILLRLSHTIGSRPYPQTMLRT